jgi:hypothetical protein
MTISNVKGQGDVDLCNIPLSFLFFILFMHTLSFYALAFYALAFYALAFYALAFML